MTASVDQCDSLSANDQLSMADITVMQRLAHANASKETAKLIVHCETHGTAGACREGQDTRRGLQGRVKRGVGTLALGGTIHRIREILRNYITAVFDWKRGSPSAEATIVFIATHAQRRTGVGCLLRC